MRPLIALIACAACLQAADTAGMPLKGLWAIDAVVSLPPENRDAKDLPRPVGAVRRYYLKDAVVQQVGSREFLIGRGVVSWQEAVAIPLDTVVAMAAFANNQVFTQVTGKEPDAPLQVEKNRDQILEPVKK